MSRLISHASRALAGGALVLSSGMAMAQPAPRDAAAAEALFGEGKRLMANGRFAEACPKLEESQRLDPAGGTVLALGFCFEGQGRTGTAWAYFTQAVAEARRDRRADREGVAAEHVRALEKKLTRVRVTVAQAAQPVRDLEVRRSGAVIGPAQWGIALPVDPGDYTFEARAPDAVPWTKTVAARGEGVVIDVDVPALQPVERAAPVATAVEPVPVPRGTTSAPRAPGPGARATGAEADGTRRDRTWAYVVGGVGLAATAVGLGFGIDAMDKWSDTKTACPAGRCTTTAGLELASSTRTAADASTALFAVGAAGLVAATVLYVLAPTVSVESGAARARVIPVVASHGGGLVVGGVL